MDGHNIIRFKYIMLIYHKDFRVTLMRIDLLLELFPSWGASVLRIQIFPSSGKCRRASRQNSAAYKKSVKTFMVRKSLQ